MWDETRRRRLEDLRDVDTQRALSTEEQAELAALLEERCRVDEMAIEAETRKSEERARHLADRIEQVQAQNRELQALIKEQESYLAKVRATLNN